MSDGIEAAIFAVISGRKVPESVANSIRTSGKVSGVPGDHYGAMDYVWKATA